MSRKPLSTEQSTTTAQELRDADLDSAHGGGNFSPYNVRGGPQGVYVFNGNSQLAGPYQSCDLSESALTCSGGALAPLSLPITNGPASNGGGDGDWGGGADNGASVEPGCEDGGFPYPCSGADDDVN